MERRTLENGFDNSTPLPHAKQMLNCDYLKAWNADIVMDTDANGFRRMDDDRMTNGICINLVRIHFRKIEH